MSLEFDNYITNNRGVLEEFRELFSEGDNKEEKAKTRSYAIKLMEDYSEVREFFLDNTNVYLTEFNAASLEGDFDAQIYIDTGAVKLQEFEEEGQRRVKPDCNFFRALEYHWRKASRNDANYDYRLDEDWDKLIEMHWSEEN